MDQIFVGFRRFYGANPFSKTESKNENHKKIELKTLKPAGVHDRPAFP
jgi:hypothetical protein